MEFVGFEKISLVDYKDLIVSTLFTKGCNFKCGFCHNSSLVLNEIEPSTIPFDEILSYLKGRKGIVEGVCISGGEPTLMVDLKEKILALKALGLKIKLDTNGYRPDVLKELIEEKLVDYVAMDIKGSLKKYSQITAVSGLDLSLIKESINLLLENKVEYEFRTTLIEEYHMEEDFEEIALLIKGANNYYLQRFKNSDNCILNNLHEVDIKKASKIRDFLLNYIPNVSFRGY